MPPLGWEAGNKPTLLQSWPHAECIAQAGALWQRGKATVMENCWGGKCAMHTSPQPCRSVLWMPPRCHKYPPPLLCDPFALGKKDREQPRKSWTQKENPPEPGNL